jgi:hypothetical protein
MEATIVCIDNSEWTRSGDYAPTRFQAQTDAVNLLAGAKTQANPENTVGVLTMAGKTPRVLVTPTPDLGKVLNSMTDIPVEGETNISASVQIAQLALKHRQNKNQRQRIVIFCGSPVKEDQVRRARRGAHACTHGGRRCRPNQHDARPAATRARWLARYRPQAAQPKAPPPSLCAQTAPHVRCRSHVRAAALRAELPPAVGAPPRTPQDKLVKIGKKLKKNNVAVDIVSFGCEVRRVSSRAGSWGLIDGAWLRRPEWAHGIACAAAGCIKCKDPTLPRAAVTSQSARHILHGRPPFTFTSSNLVSFPPASL